MVTGGGLASAAEAAGTRPGNSELAGGKHKGLSAVGARMER